MKKQEVIVTKTREGLEAHANVLQRKIMTLADERDALLLVIQRLRNEESYINSVKAENEAEKRRLNDLLNAQAAEHQAHMAAQRHAKEENVRLKTDAEQKRQDAMASEKRSEAKLKAAEAVEFRNKQVLAQIQAEKAKNDAAIAKAKSIEASADEKLDKVKERIALAYEAEKNNASDKKKNEAEAERIKKLDASVTKKESDADKLMVDAKVLQNQANATLEKARKTAADGQLSVDRQWNEIEIQKKKLKIMRLQIEKLADEKGVAKELKKLEGK